MEQHWQSGQVWKEHKQLNVERVELEEREIQLKEWEKQAVLPGMGMDESEDDEEQWSAQKQVTGTKMGKKNSSSNGPIGHGADHASQERRISLQSGTSLPKPEQRPDDFLLMLKGRTDSSNRRGQHLAAVLDPF